MSSGFNLLQAFTQWATYRIATCRQLQWTRHVEQLPELLVQQQSQFVALQKHSLCTTHVRIVQVELKCLKPYAEELIRVGQRPTLYSDYLQRRSQLVANHSSLPAIVEGVECMSAATWVYELMRPLKIWLIVVGMTAAAVSTIACSKGVFLVVISGAVQALAAWALLLHTDRLPRRWDMTDITCPGNFYMRMVIWAGRFLGWFAEVMLRPLWMAAQCCFLLLPGNWCTLWQQAVICCCSVPVSTVVAGRRMAAAAKDTAKHGIEKLPSPLHRLSGMAWEAC